MPIFPDRIFIKLPWVAAVTLTSEGGYTSWRLRLNSPYDPWLSSGWDQTSALGWGEWGLRYNRYICFGSKWFFNCSQADSTGASETIFGFKTSPSSGNFIVPSTQLYRKDPHIKYTVIGNADSGGSPTNKKIGTGYIKHHIVEAISKQAYNDQLDKYSALVTGNPSYTPFLDIFVDDLVTGPGGIGTCELQVQITATFYLMFYFKKDLIE